ncbi:MAG: hypothetical protein AB8F74_07850 [Saprospiraceae bacterium]
MILESSRLALLVVLIFTTSFNSCSGCFKSGVQSTPKLVKAFAKNAGKNVGVAYQATKEGTNVVVKNGRKIPVGKAADVGKIAIPDAKRLKSFTSIKNNKPTSVAHKTVKDSEIDLLLYDSGGNPIIYADGSEHKVVYNAARNTYDGKAAGIVDDILKKVDQGKITTEKDLEATVHKLVNKQLGKNASKNPYVMDASTGNLTFNVQFDSGSQIIGTINVYKTVKKGLATGAGGYYILKKTEGVEFKPFIKTTPEDLEKNTQQIIKAYGKKDK